MQDTFTAQFERGVTVANMKLILGMVSGVVIAAVLILWSGTQPDIEVTSATDYLLSWQDPVTIETRMGPVTGISGGKSLAFLGLPYAVPPVGDRRFRAPEPAHAWLHTRDATRFPNICIQAEPPALLGGDNGHTRSEDCMYLNIFTPSTQGDKRAVLFWIHGGSYTGGSANGYDGSILAEQGNVVVVTINYRLGMLGFLDLSAFGGEFLGSASNGIRDQILALQWVRDNISDYGGDAGNVTLFGESAGGGSVLAIMASPSADHLYHRAIDHSGGEVHKPSIDSRTALTQHLNVDHLSLLATLRALSPDAILATQENVQWGGGGYVDGAVVTRGIREAIMARGAAGVPLIAGSNRDEGTLFSRLIPWYLYSVIEEAVAENIVATMSGAQYVAELKQAHPDDSRKQRFERVWTDLLVRGGVNAAARASAAGPGGWLYRFDLPASRLPNVGATHGAEISFTFNQFARNLPATAYFYDPQDPVVRRLALSWSNTIIQFAKTGDPNGAGLPHWPQYTAERREALILDDNPRIEANLHAAERERWGDTESLSVDFR